MKIYPTTHKPTQANPRLLRPQALNSFTIVACVMAALDSRLLTQSVKGHKMTTLLAIILHDEHLLLSGAEADPHCCPLRGTCASTFCRSPVTLWKYKSIAELMYQLNR